MTIRLSPSMDKEGYSFLAPFTIPEAPLRYFSQMCFRAFLSNGQLKVCFFSDVARSYSEGKGRRFGCHSNLCFLEWT